MRFKYSFVCFCFFVGLLSCTLSLPSGGNAAGNLLARTDPNAGLFPDSSLVDFQFLLNAPAGQYGFLTARSGHFVWKTGVRARFWGINISNQSIFIPKDQIDKVVDVFARAGTNMVRFEAMDSVNGLTDIQNSNTSRHLDENKLALLDYWTAKLRAKGIYYYFDLLDFRQFKSGDDVSEAARLGRAARPYAFFDRRLIDLQKEYARQLLTHINPITKLRYVDDPALALLEVCNEHGMFFKAEKMDDLVEPYATGLRQQWNRWLISQYGSRDALKTAWAQISGVNVLGDVENPGDYSVKLPAFSAASLSDPNVTDVRRAPVRIRDGVRFFFDLQKSYFHEMKSYLREIGLKVPITGVVSTEILPDVASVAQEMDYTAENYYADHPAFSGKEWEGAFFYNNNNPLHASSIWQIAPWLGALRWEGKPVVIREWAVVWPNAYRCIAIPEMAAYAAYQDLDAVLLFGYQTARKPEMINDFDHQCDPPVWGLYALGAAAFLRGGILPAPNQATIRYTADQLFRWPNTINGLHRTAWFARLNSTISPVEDKSARTLTLSPGDTKGLPELLDQFGKAGLPLNRSMAQSAILRSSTGQIIRNTKQGILTLNAPRVVAICGDLPVNKAVKIGPFTLSTPTSIGALMAVSLDELPLSKSRNFVVKMVSKADNTEQSIEVANAGAPGRIKLKNWGRAPVRTHGRTGTKPTFLMRNGTLLMELGMMDGTWELVCKNGLFTLVCDTPGMVKKP